ncbi:SMI1/KNR4 family protein [Streptomyces sp. ITFR-16]|uniref:SMI1/KNR4 family protein n=1 Tax=Streptomyces sp. ITFR-16 TaxID=3075198 RepID=UPI002889D557|nr:SMI1/KNR4 family protein [Streptomyces sp. ITFR-16]WNI24579.1 SMI1/KNR4 family protein [Streptomyces sp. ITFR-16]
MSEQAHEAVASVWSRIEKWYAERDASHFLLPPATSDDIAAVEAELGVSLPEAVRASLLRHNGSTDGGWPAGSLLSCTGMAEETKVWRDLLEDGSFDDVTDFNAADESASALRPGWWNTGWVSLDADGGGNGAVLDLSPGTGGRVGQIIDMDHEVGPSGPTAEDFADYLLLRLEELEDCVVVDGEYVEAG